MSDATRLEELEKRLREAEERARRAERSHLAERRRAEEADRARLEERQRAEEADRARLEERQRADEERQRAEEERQRAEVSEQQTRPTTFDEYIAACHSLVYSKFIVERDQKLTSKGSITSPRNKWCPTSLRPWPGFIEQQRVIFGAIYETFPSTRRAFESRSFLDGLGHRIARRPIADEKTLEYFLHNSVEDPVRTIMDQLKEVDAVGNIFAMGNGIIFENHPHAISDVSEEVVNQRTPSTPPSTPGHNFDINQLRPDQICVYRSDDARSVRRTMLYISEYKPPHKLTAPHLRAGLRPMNIYQDVVNRKKIPTSVDRDARFNYHAERLTSSAITQTYHYMIEGGLEYGLMTTGEAIVFLKIDWKESGTLLYHLAEPGAEVSAHANHFHLCTAVAQYLAFSLLALGAPGEQRLHGQDERERATASLKTWSEDFETTLRSIPEDERQAPESSPAYIPENYEGVDRSPYLLRWGRRRSRSREPDHPEPGGGREESSDEDGPSDMPETPSPAERRPRRGGHGGRGGGGSRRSERILAQRPRGGGGLSEGQRSKTDVEEDRPYCTQRCLRGLVMGRPVDWRCPNVMLHKTQNTNRADGGCTHHSINHAQFLDLLWKQFKHTLDDGITPLVEGGARGVLFKVTLLAYGYTFVGKGTVRAFIKDLEHEAAIYKRLEPLQGKHVPVFLGSIDLRTMDRIYYFDHRVYVIYMVFLSFGGGAIDSLLIMDDARESMETQVVRSLRAIHNLGVVHTDVRATNILVDSRTKKTMVIDLERAILLERPRAPLGQLGPNKRRWNADAKREDECDQKRDVRGYYQMAFSEDIRVAKTMFARNKACQVG